MDEILTTIKESISNTTNSKLHQLCQIINTEVLRRYKTGQQRSLCRGRSIGFYRR